MRLSQIWIYPVKSLPGIKLEQAVIDKRGFAWDRHWMLVDEQGDFLSQRRLPAMALINVAMQPAGVELSVASRAPLLLTYGKHSDQQIAVKVWADHLNAYKVSDIADNWLSDFLGTRVQLVCMPDEVVRKVDPDYATVSDQTGFSDGFPFLLLSQASIDDLNRKIDDPSSIMDVKRFRPNLLIEGVPAFAEDSWKQVQIGDIRFRVVKPCSRCVITTVNPETAEKGVEPLKTLATYRRQGNKVYFGQNLLHDATGSLSAGDEVRVIET